MKALVHGSRICETAADTFPVAAPLAWVDCDETVTTAHEYADGGFRPPRPSSDHEWDGVAWAVPAERAATVHNAVIDTQIRAIEVRELAPRYSREAILVGIVKDHMRDYSVTGATAIAELTTVGGPRFNAGFTKLKALDDQIKTLRAQRLA